MHGIPKSSHEIQTAKQIINNVHKNKSIVVMGFVLGFHSNSYSTSQAVLDHIFSFRNSNSYQHDRLKIAEKENRSYAGHCTKNVFFVVYLC